MSTELQPLRAEPLALLAQMIEKGCDPEALKKMMDIAESWKRARAAEEYAQDMALCQKEMPPIFRSEKNNFTGSTYAPFEDINKQAKPIYTKHGFSLAFSEEVCPTPGQARIVLDVSHSGGHSKRSWIDLPIDGEGAKGGKPSMNAVQGKVSTVSGYGRRTLLKLAFAISETGEDQDGNHGAETLNEGELHDLCQEFEECQKLAHSKGAGFTTPEKFCRWLDPACERFRDIRHEDFPKAMDWLKRQRHKLQNGNGTKPATKPQATAEYSEFGPDPIYQGE